MIEKFSERVENFVGREKLLFMNNFSFSHRVFKRLVQQECKNKGLFGKGFYLYLMKARSVSMMSEGLKK